MNFMNELMSRYNKFSKNETSNLTAQNINHDEIKDIKLSIKDISKNGLVNITFNQEL